MRRCEVVCCSPVHYTPNPMCTESRKPPRAAYAGIFLISAATLLLQVTFTRIFSVSIWYHFAFLVVSTALFGFGASGVVLSLTPRSERDLTRLGWTPAFFATSAVVAYLGTNAVPFSPFQILTSPIQILWFLIYDLLLTAPFFFAGATVVLLLRTFPERAGGLYALDLIGAAIGSFLVFLSLPRLGAAGSVFLASALGFASAALLAPSGRARRPLGVVAALHLPLLLFPHWLPDVRIDSSKPLSVEVNERGGRIAYTAWNLLSRIDVVEKEGIDPMILIDSAAMTAIARPPDESSPYLADISTLAYRIRDGASAVIIGSGGGMDVQNALALGARRVTAVEINPIIIDLVTGRYREQVGDVFADARVRCIRDEGRSFIDRSDARDDVIQLTLIDTWAAGVSGAYSLTENYLYTTEAFRAYFDHLTPDGLLSITRWHFEAPRLVSLAHAALVAEGISDPSRHILVMEKEIRTTFLLKRDPFRPEEAARARRFADAIGAEILHDPTDPAARTFYSVFLAQTDPSGMIAAAPTALHPVTDDNPFFFQMARWRNLRLGSLKAITGRNFLEPLAAPVGQIALVTAFVLALLLSALLLLVPIAGRGVPRAGRARWLGYFFGLGIAFIVVEVVLMQRFALFLGHPTYSVTTVLFAILLFSGLGSAWSGTRRGTTRRILRPILWLLPVAILLLAVGVPPLSRALIGLALPLRLFLAIGFIAPVAFLMGVPFPVGIRAAGSDDPAFIPWGWAANGCASVIGSVCAVLGAMTYNFSIMLIAAGIVYVLSIFSLSRMRIELA